MIPPRKKPTVRQMLAPKIPADVTETRRQGQGIGDIQAIGQMARTVIPEVLRNAPGTSVPMAAYDAVQAGRQGDMTGAALAALGAVPFAGAMRYADEAGDVARAAMRGAEASSGIRAWHGSPYRGIEKTGFDLSKVGSGEGSQAYSHGIYFAEKRPVAEWYRDTYSAQRNQPGALYEVELGMSPQETLRWEQTLAEQDPAVMRAVNAALKKVQRPLETRSAKELESIIQRIDPDGDWRGSGLSKDDLLEAAKEMGVADYLAQPISGERTGFSAYEQLTSAAGGGGKNKSVGQRAASQALRESGVVGVQYPSLASRSSRPSGGSNYVVFDPQRIKILQALGIAGMLGVGARQSQQEVR